MKPVAPAERTLRLKYAIRNIAGAAARLEAEGRRVLYLNIGDPLLYDFQTPPALVEAATRGPDVILLDMKMPVMDGWEFARVYRAAPGQHAPIVVVTAAADAAGRAAEVAADGHLPKPFDLDDLFRVVDEYCPVS